MAIDADEALTITELGNCLRDLDHAGRASVWFWVGQKLEGSGERAGTLWRDRIEPIMVRAWPKEPILGNEDVWSRIAHALVNAGDAFPDAVEATKSAIGKVQHSYGLVEALRKQEIPRRYPEAALKLIERVIPEDASWQAGKLGEFLEIIKSAKPTLEGSVEYKHLREIVQKNLL